MNIHDCVYHYLLRICAGKQLTNFECALNVISISTVA
jgi:hypothetical protein